MATSRVRLINPPGYTGSVTRTPLTGPPSSYSSITRDIAYSECIDATGPKWEDHTLRITHIRKDIEPITGTYVNPVNLERISCEGKPVPLSFSGSGAGPASILWTPAQSSASALTTMLLGRSNPNRPIVDLPVFWAELKDLPKMIKQAADAIGWAKGWAKGGPGPTAQGIASANLAYQFGWGPLMDDLWKLATFQDAYEKRRDQLTRLYSGRGLRRNIKLESFSDTASGSSTTNAGSQVTIPTRWNSKRSYKCWGSVRWTPTGKIPGDRTPSDREIYRSALGLNLSAASMYELIPWSWLIDWFSTAGDFLAAHRNSIPVAPSNVCIMRKFEVVHKYQETGTDKPGITWGGATVTWVRKERQVITKPTPTLAMRQPFLEASQLSILGSLGIIKGNISNARRTGVR